MINGAQRTLDIEQFYVSNKAGEPLEDIIPSIEQAAPRGVQVRLIADARFSKTYPETIDRLAKHDGITVRGGPTLPLRFFGGGLSCCFTGCTLMRTNEQHAIAYNGFQNNRVFLKNKLQAYICTAGWFKERSCTANFFPTHGILFKRFEMTIPGRGKGNTAEDLT